MHQNRACKASRKESERINAVLEKLGEVYPAVGTALEYETPFQLLVAVILSAQCTDRQVNKTTSRLFKKYRTPQDFACLEPESLAGEIKSCGLYRSKSRYIVETARQLVEKYDSLLPLTRRELQALPGVGRKSANVLLNVAFNKPVLPVDTHVFRVAKRLGFAAGKTPEKTEEELLRIIPALKRHALHHQLIKHGREVCLARKPKCGDCVLYELCPSSQTSNKNLE